MRTQNEMLERFHAALEKRRGALRRLLAMDEVELTTNPGEVGDIVDAAVDTEDHEVRSQLADAESRELLAIDKALERIANRQFGKCEVCEKDIPLARLNALPYATQCIECQRAAEMAHCRGADAQVSQCFEDPTVDRDLPVRCRKHCGNLKNCHGEQRSL